MPKRTMIVLVEVEADTEEQMPDKHDLATAVSGVLRNAPEDPFRWGDPTVYENLSDLVADCGEGRNPDLPR